MLKRLRMEGDPMLQDQAADLAATVRMLGTDGNIDGMLMLELAKERMGHEANCDVADLSETARDSLFHVIRSARQILFPTPRLGTSADQAYNMTAHVQQPNCTQPSVTTDILR